MRRGIANDPQRSARIAEAALDVIAQHGLRAATHRAIAKQAGVPLGSVTYYYATLDDLLVAAFTTLGRQIEPRYNEAIIHAESQDAARQVLVEVICGKSRATDRELRLAREMYAYGSVSTRVGDLVRIGEARAIAALSQHFPEPAARALDALLEGWWIYQSWNAAELDRIMVRHAIDAIVDKFIEPTAEPGVS